MSFAESLLPRIVEENHNSLLGKHDTWLRASLGAVAGILNGFAFKSEFFSSSEGVPLARIRDVLRGRSETYYSGEYDERYVIDRGDILVGMDGDFNCAYWQDGRALLNQRVCKVIVDERLYDQSFLAYVLPGYLSAINDHTSSVTVKHLSSCTMSNIPLPLPPLVEQRAIAAKIDALFSELDKGVEQLQTIKQQLKQYRQAVLKAAFEGKLTAAWRAEQQAAGSLPSADQLLEEIRREREAWYRQRLGEWEKAMAEWQVAASKDSSRKKPQQPNRPKALPAMSAVEVARLPDLPNGWNWARVGDLLLEGTCNGISVKGSDTPPGVPALKLNSMSAMGFDYTVIRYIPVSQDVVDSLHVVGGDFFVSRGNGSLDLVGRGTLAQSPPRPIVFPDTMIRLRLSRRVRAWVAWYWGTRQLRRQVESSAKTTAGIHKISQRQIESYYVPLAPPQEADRIVQKIQARISSLDELERITSQALEQTKLLRQSILEKAFEGRLLSEAELASVRSDPGYEPADKLLERIRTENCMNRQSSQSANSSRRAQPARRSRTRGNTAEARSDAR